MADSAGYKNQYRSASIAGNNRMIFNIRDNGHCLIAAVAYRFGAVYIKFVGTHAECDKIDTTTVGMEETK